MILLFTYFFISSNLLLNEVTGIELVMIKNTGKDYCLQEYSDAFWAAPCDDLLPTQMFEYDETRNTLRVISSGQCMSVDTANYNGVSYDNVTLTGNQDELGQRPVANDCNNTLYEQWIFDASERIVNNKTGWCLDIHDYHYNRNDTKARVDGANCTLNTNQQWQLLNQTNYPSQSPTPPTSYPTNNPTNSIEVIKISNVGKDYCLTEYPGTTEQGDVTGAFWASPCEPSLDTQMFVYDLRAKTFTVSSTDKCVDVGTANYNDAIYDERTLTGNQDEYGQRPVPNDCDGSAYEKWILDESGRIINNKTEKCLEIRQYHYNIDYFRARVDGAYCTLNANQQWQLVSAETTTTISIPTVSPTSSFTNSVYNIGVCVFGSYVLVICHVFVC